MIAVVDQAKYGLLQVGTHRGTIGSSSSGDDDSDDDSE
jgi:hypothetical protein